MYSRGQSSRAHPDLRYCFEQEMLASWTRVNDYNALADWHTAVKLTLHFAWIVWFQQQKFRARAQAPSGGREPAGA